MPPESSSSEVMDEDDEYTIPLTGQRVFGAGITRKRVKFVPPKPAVLQTSAKSANGPAVADLYRSIVLQDDSMSNKSRESNKRQVPQGQSGPTASDAQLAEAICEICNLPLTSAASPLASPNSHEATLVHQVCLTHSHPPSHVDRTRKGLKYLSSYGWDPDSRLGLGATGDGRLAPVRGKVKNDTLGVGFEEEMRRSKKGRGVVGVEKKVEKLDAKKVRKMEAEGRRKREGLQDMFYGGGEVEKYLGLGGQ